MLAELFSLMTSNKIEIVFERDVLITLTFHVNINKTAGIRALAQNKRKISLDNLFKEIQSKRLIL